MVPRVTGSEWSYQNHSICVPPTHDNEIQEQMPPFETCTFGFAPTYEELENAYTQVHEPLRWIFDFNFYRQRKVIESFVRRKAPGGRVAMPTLASHSSRSVLIRPTFQYSSEANETAETVIKSFGNSEFYVLKWRRSDKLDVQKYKKSS